MKVRCDRNELAERLQAVLGIVAAAPTTRPILKDFLLRARGEGLLIEATDLDISARIRVDRVEVEEEGELALDANRLQSLIRELPTNTVSIDGDDSVATIHSESFQVRLLGDDTSEFPELQEFAAEHSLEIPREKFVEMIRRVGIAASRDQGRYQLTGIFFEVQGEKMTLTATDGKRMTHDTMRIDNPSELLVSAIVPNRAIDVLIKALSTGEEIIRLAFSETELQVDFGHGQLLAKLIEGTYPDYKLALPTEKKTKVSARRADLLAAVRSASLVTDRETATVRFRFEPTSAHLESQASHIGESKIEIPISFEGEEVEIRFNPVYFLDALRSVGEEQVRMEFCGPGRPGTIRGGLHYRHMLMPLVLE